MTPTRGQALGVEADRRKNASLAIRAVLRGLELDQVVFQYDETACPDFIRACTSPGDRSSVVRLRSVVVHHDALDVAVLEQLGCDA